MVNKKGKDPKSDIISVSEEFKENFETIKKAFTESLANKHFFILALSYGYKEGVSTPHKGGKFGVTRWTYLEDEEKALLQSIALSETKDLLVIEKQSSMTSICEEYANTGLKLLYQKFIRAKDKEDFILDLEKDIRKLQK